MKATLGHFYQDSNIQLQVHAILTKISEWESRVPLSRDILSIIKWLNTDLQKQCHSDRFFLTLETFLFKGTIHCEACLASLLPSFIEHSMSDSNKYKEMNVLSELKVEYPHFICFHQLILIFFLIDRAMGRLFKCQNIVAHVVGHFSASWWKGLEKMLFLHMSWSLYGWNQPSCSNCHTLQSFNGGQQISTSILEKLYRKKPNGTGQSHWHYGKHILNFKDLVRLVELFEHHHNNQFLHPQLREVLVKGTSNRQNIVGAKFELWYKFCTNVQGRFIFV